MRSRQSLEGSVNHRLPRNCLQSARLPSLLEQQRFPRLPLHSEISVSSRCVVDSDAARNQFRGCQVTAAQQIGNYRFLRQHGTRFSRRPARGLPSASANICVAASGQDVCVASHVCIADATPSTGATDVTATCGGLKRQRQIVWNVPNKNALFTPAREVAPAAPAPTLDIGPCRNRASISVETCTRRRGALP